MLKVEIFQLNQPSGHPSNQLITNNIYYLSSFSLLGDEVTWVSQFFVVDGLGFGSPNQLGVFGEKLR